jgi:hypothetical protein
MDIQLIKCRNKFCSKNLYVNVNDIRSVPVVFCGEKCVNSFLDYEISQKEANYEDPVEINKLVQNVIGYTQKIEREFENFRKIRSTYFELFKSRELKSETYIRKWSFNDEDK